MYQNEVILISQPNLATKRADVDCSDGKMDRLMDERVTRLGHIISTEGHSRAKIEQMDLRSQLS